VLPRHLQKRNGADSNVGLCTAACVDFTQHRLLQYVSWRTHTQTEFGEPDALEEQTCASGNSSIGMYVHAALIEYLSRRPTERAHDYFSDELAFAVGV
jgi:hypothetical protein